MPTVDISDHAYSVISLTARLTHRSESEVIDELLGSVNDRPKAALHQASRSLPSRSPHRRSRQGTQKDALRILLEEKYPVGTRFSLSEVYRHAIPLLEEMSASPNGLKPAIRRYLQELRDQGLLEFLGGGNYRRLE